MLRRSLSLAAFVGVIGLAAVGCNDAGGGTGSTATSVPATALTATVTARTGTVGGITLEDARALLAVAMPEVAADDITDVQFEGGKLTLETSWDDTHKAQAESLCSKLRTMSATAVSPQRSWVRTRKRSPRAAAKRQPRALTGDAGRALARPACWHLRGTRGFESALRPAT